MRYWELDENGAFKSKVSELEHEFRVKAYQISKLQAQTCVAVLLSISCLRCGAECRVANRTEFTKANSSQRWTCAECTEQLERTRRRQQAERIAEMEAAAAARESGLRQLIWRIFPNPPRPDLDIETLSLRDAVIFVAALRSFQCENYDSLLRPRDCRYKLAPHDSYAREIITRLKQRGLIQVSAASNLDAFAFGHSETVTLREPLLADYDIVIAQDSQTRRDIALAVEERLRNSDWPDHWLTDRRSVAREIAIETCLGYMSIHMGKRHLPFAPGRKTRDVLTQMLQHYSLSQCFYFIWRGVVQAVDRMVTDRLPLKHAANCVVGNMERAFLRASSESWAVPHYNWDHRCCDCTIVEVFLNELQRGGAESFRVRID